MKPSSEFFSECYSGATTKFVTSCAAAGAAVEEWPHPGKGPQGQELATYSAFFGEASAQELCVIISGTHGLEGLAGSGCQLSLVDEIASLAASTGFLFVHMLNPWGAAWGRRQNESNVDLNRNFLPFGAAPLPDNADYDALHGALMNLNADSRARSEAEQKISEFIASRGREAYISAIFRGQYSQPRGINFGGAAAAWSTQTLEKILRRYLHPQTRAIVVDLHTGVGAFGQGTVISTAPADSPELVRLRNWLDNDFVSLATHKEAFPYEVVGDLCSGVRQRFASQEITAVALEFGTYDVEQLVQLQVEDCLNWSSGESSAQLGHDIRARLERFFYPQDAAWFESISARTSNVVRRMMRGLLRTQL